MVDSHYAIAHIMQCYTKATTKAPRKSSSNSSSKIFSLLYLCCTLKLSAELIYFPAQLPLAALFLFIFLHLQLQWCKVTEFPIHNIDTTLRLYTAILILSPSSSPSTHTINNDTPQQLYFTVLRSMPNVQVYISKTIAFMYERTYYSA